MCTEKLVKIGVAGQRDFYTFEACDEEEAAAVCDCLVSHAKNAEKQDEKTHLKGHPKAPVEVEVSTAA